jgi:hypothetical protein
MKKHALICNLMYKLDTRQGCSDLLRLLKYVQYRDDRDQHVPQMDGLERWYDRGLGDNYRTISRACFRLSQDKINQDQVLARMLVVSPHPDLVAALPKRLRQTALRDLTETMVERYFEANHLPTPEYAFVIHDPQTESGNQRLHSHVFFPATVPDLEGRRTLDLRRPQMPRFHQVRDEAITEVWTHFLGAERVAELDQHLLTEADRGELTEAPAPGSHVDETRRELDELDHWFGLSR